MRRTFSAIRQILTGAAMTLLLISTAGAVTGTGVTTANLVQNYRTPPKADAGNSPEKAARDRLQASIDAVFAALNDPQYANESNKDVLFNRLESIVAEVFDYTAFSALAVGRPWHTFTPDQQARFTDAFADLLRSSYIERVRDYSGNGVSYTGERKNTQGNKVIVMTTLDYQGKSVPVEYRMVDTDGVWVVYDVVVEGVSLVQNYRSQFQSLLKNNSDPEILITKVRERAAYVRQHGGDDSVPLAK